MTGATGETEASTRNAPVRSAAVRLHAHAPTQACSSGAKAAVVLPKLLLFLSCRIYQQIGLEKYEGGALRAAPSWSSQLQLTKAAVEGRTPTPTLNLARQKYLTRIFCAAGRAEHRMSPVDRRDLSKDQLVAATQETSLR